MHVIVTCHSVSHLQLTQTFSLLPPHLTVPNLSLSFHQLLGFESWVLRVSVEAVTPDTETTDVETVVATVTVLPANSSTQAQAEGQKVWQSFLYSHCLLQGQCCANM